MIDVRVNRLTMPEDNVRTARPCVAAVQWRDSMRSVCFFSLRAQPSPAASHRPDNKWILIIISFKTRSLGTDIIIQQPTNVLLLLLLLLYTRNALPVLLLCIRHWRTRCPVDFQKVYPYMFVHVKILKCRFHETGEKTIDLAIFPSQNYLFIYFLYMLKYVNIFIIFIYF